LNTNLLIDRSRMLPMMNPEPTTIEGEFHHPASAQPIMAFKELEIDQVRYMAWKSSLESKARKYRSFSK